MKSLFILLLLTISLGSVAQKSNEIPLEVFGKPLVFDSKVETVNELLLSIGATLEKETNQSNSYKGVILFGKFSCLQFNLIKQKSKIKGVLAGISLSKTSQATYSLTESQILETINSKIIAIYGNPNEMNLKNDKQGMICNKWILDNDIILLNGTMYNGQGAFMFIGSKNEAPSVK